MPAFRDTSVRCQPAGTACVTRCSARCPAARSSSASCCELARVRGAAWRSARVPAFLGVIDTAAGLALAVGAAYVVVQARRAGEAAPALARAPQADPLVHLHRLLPGLAHRRRSSCCAGSCCSTTSARTSCRAICAALADQARFLAQSTALEIQRAGGRDVAGILERRQANATRRVGRRVDCRRAGRPRVRRRAPARRPRRRRRRRPPGRGRT